MSNPKSNLKGPLVGVDASPHLYAVFSKYSPSDLSCCACCHTEAFVKRLKTTALKEIEEDDLIDYLSSALMLCTGIESFKYFLPRLFSELEFYDWEISEALKRAEWKTWPEEEIRAIQAYMLSKKEDLGSFFDCENIGYFSIEELFEIWNEDQAFFHACIDYWVDVESSFFEPFYRIKKRDAYMPAKIKKELSERLESLFFEYADEDPKHAENISWVFEYVSWCKTTLPGSAEGRSSSIK